MNSMMDTSPDQVQLLTPVSMLSDNVGDGEGWDGMCLALIFNQSFNQLFLDLQTQSSMLGQQATNLDSRTRPVTLNVSSMFPPNAFGLPTDCVLFSSDRTCFFLNAAIVLAPSSNRLKGLLWSVASGLSASSAKLAPHTASVLNIILLSIYGLSCSQFNPTFQELEAAVDGLQTYGISPPQLVTSAHPLFSLILNHAPYRPLDVYILATSNCIEDLAVATSSHLLSLKLYKLTDEMCLKIGAVYLKRLFDLHLDREGCLKAALSPFPTRHAPTKSCRCGAGGAGGAGGNLHRAWAQGLADLTWDIRPDISVNMLKLKLRPIADVLDCTLCQQSVEKRIDDLCSRWSLVRVRVSFGHAPFLSPILTSHLLSKPSDVPRAFKAGKGG
jgi:hypothetical protein